MDSSLAKPGPITHLRLLSSMLCPHHSTITSEFTPALLHLPLQILPASSGHRTPFKILPLPSPTDFSLWSPDGTPNMSQSLLLLDFFGQMMFLPKVPLFLSRPRPPSHQKSRTALSSLNLTSHPFFGSGFPSRLPLRDQCVLSYVS